MELSENEKKLRSGLLLTLGLLVIVSGVLIFNMVQNNACEEVSGGQYLLKDDCDAVITEVCGEFLGVSNPNADINFPVADDNPAVIIDITG